MKELHDRIGRLEETVLEVIQRWQTVKKQNSILTEENQRLKHYINQLSKNQRGVEEVNSEISSDSEAVLRERDINIKLIREELDSCISELEAYIKATSN